MFKRKNAPFLDPLHFLHLIRPFLVMLGFRSYKVSVRVDDQDLPIYKPEYDEDTKTATCWVASEDGQQFTILYEQDKPLPHATNARVYLDGNKQCVTSCVSNDRHQQCIEGVRVSPTARRPFLFASLETTGMSRNINRRLDSFF